MASRHTIIMSMIMLVLAVGAVLILYTEDFDRAEKMFERGEYVSAFQIYLDLANAGDRRAQFAVGKIYEIGLGRNIYNPDLAISYLRSSAQAGYGHAQMELADAYYSGARWFNQDLIQAETWWGRASENNLFAGWYRLLGLYPVFGPGFGDQLTSMPDNTFRILNMADEGEPFAMALAGHFYLTGGNLEQNFEQARFWFEKALAAGHPFAATGLAEVLSRSQGNDTQVARLLLDAAELGDTTAQLHLARLYEAGAGIAQSEREALFWTYVVLRQSLVDVSDREELMARRTAVFDSASQNIIRQEANEWRAKEQPVHIIGAQGMEF